MSDLLTTADLENAKKHDTFHSEVITGKAGGVSGGDDIDYATNEVTGQVQKTLPATVNEIASYYGWVIAGLFADGFTINSRNEVGQDASGNVWRYTGALPFTVPAGTTPTPPTYEQLVETDHNELTNRNAEGAHNVDAIDISNGLHYQNEIASTRSALDIQNYRAQGTTSDVAGTIHDYTDAARTLQLDKVGGVGTDYILGLRRANNPVRRPDQGAEYVGGAGFLRASLDEFVTTPGVKTEQQVFVIDANADFQWNGYLGTVNFVNAKADNGLYAYQFTASVESQFVVSFDSASGGVLNIQDAVAGTRTDITSPANQTSGMRISALAGGIDIAPSSGSPVTVRGNINSQAGSDMTITAIGSTLNLNGSNGVRSLAPHKYASYTVATLPSASTFLQHVIFVSDGDAGSPCLAVSDGTNWLRIPFGAPVATS